MSADILNEMQFLLRSLLLGIAITFLYDILRILRRVIRHSTFFVSIEDTGYWLFCAACIFRMLYQENNGVIRWFVVLGAALGMLLYRVTLSRFFVPGVSCVLNRILKEAGSIFRKFWKPFGRILKFAKKKLTGWLKMIKMILCKR